MASISKSDLKKIKEYCKTIIQNEISRDLVYHGWSATETNLKTLDTLSKKLKLGDDDIHIAKTAVLFLYTGFVKKDLRPYEASLMLANSFLKELGIDHEIIEDVKNCIRLKVDNINPSTLPERVFIDTAYAYFGEKGLRKRIEGTWEERNFLRKEKQDLLTALEIKYDEIVNHKYYTAAAQNLYDYRKTKNLLKLKATINKEKNKNNLSSNKTAMTMFKTALRNHIDLINIADKKAGIMISINAILMTVMIPILGSYIIDVSKFIVPSIILVLTCGTAVILATLATRPQLSKGEVDDQSVYKGEKSLFYFGNFFEMEKKEYRNAVKDVIVRDITLENSIINDLYDMGVVLGVKYKRLRWCYIIFAGGIGLTLVSFIISFFLFPEI